MRKLIAAMAVAALAGGCGFVAGWAAAPTHTAVAVVVPAPAKPCWPPPSPGELGRRRPPIEREL